MKLQSLILTAIFFIASVTAFGQKSPVKSTEIKPASSKSAETKPMPVKMPTVQEILAKYVKAIGGKEANEKIKSRYSKGVMEIMPMGIKGVFESYAAAPNKSYNKTALAGVGDIIEGFDGQTAWSINQIQGNHEKEGEELMQTKLNNDFYRETNLAKLYPKMELKGTEKVGDSDAYVIVGTPIGSPPETFYFDTKSGLMVRQDVTAVSPEGKIPTKTYFYDVREVDGVKTPFKIVSILPQFEITLTINEIKNNVAVEDSKFAKPKE